MFSGEIGVNLFGQKRLIFEGKFGDDPLIPYKILAIFP